MKKRAALPPDDTIDVRPRAFFEALRGLCREHHVYLDEYGRAYVPVRFVFESKNHNYAFNLHWLSTRHTDYSLVYSPESAPIKLGEDKLEGECDE